MKRTLLSAVLIMALWVPYGAVQSANPPESRYTITDLGTLGGDSEALAVNNVGQVAGRYATGSGYTYRAFVWEDGVMQDLGTLGGDRSEAYGINDSGQVVGVSYISSGDFRAFLWQNGSMQDLGTLGGDDSIALDINNSGQVAGSASRSDGRLHAALWSGGITDLGALSLDSQAYGLNGSGQVVGSAQVGTVSPWSMYDHAFLWNGSMQDLGTLGWAYSHAYAINDNGQVVGNLVNEGQNDWHAVLWDGSMHDLGGTQSTAVDINNAGLIVGSSGGHAVLWESGQMLDLNSQIPVDSGWLLQSARAINDKGQIVGRGSLNGQARAYLLTPQAYHWANPGGGSWHLSTNWDPQGIPGAGDTTIFDLGGEYTVDAATPPVSILSLNSFSIDRLVIASTGTVSFNNLDLNLAYDAPGDPSLQVNDGGTANVNSGATTFSHAVIGGAPPQDPANPPAARLQVFNSGTTLTGSGRLTIGGEGAGELFVANGGHLSSAEARLGGSQPGSAVVGGDGSLWDTGSIAVGYAGQGALTIENGGRVNSNTAVVGFGDQNSHSNVIVDGFAVGSGQPSLWAVGGTLTGEDGAWIDVQNGAQLAVNQDVYLKGADLKLYPSEGSQAATHLEVLGDLVIGGGTSGSVFGLYSGISPSSLTRTQAWISGNLLVGRDGNGLVLVDGRATGLTVTDPSKGLCQIGDTHDAGMHNEGHVFCRAVTIGSSVVTGGLGHVRLSGTLLATELVRVGQMGGGAPALVDMVSGSDVAQLTGLEGIYIGPTGVVSGTGAIRAGGLGLSSEGVIMPSVQVIQAQQAQMAGVVQANPATLTITGTLTISPTGQLAIPVTGSGAGQYGSLGVTGATILDGVLALAFRGGYAPSQGDTFTFLTATGGVTGAFDSVAISGLAPGFEYEVTLVDGQLVLEALNDGVPLGRVFLPLVVR
mgnify:FL=1